MSRAAISKQNFHSKFQTFPFSLPSVFPEKALDPRFTDVAELEKSIMKRSGKLRFQKKSAEELIILLSLGFLEGLKEQIQIQQSSKGCIGAPEAGLSKFTPRAQRDWEDNF